MTDGRARDRAASGKGLSSLEAAAPRISLGDFVAERLREAILNGELAPNQHLREEEIAERLHVSRGPVHDAFVVLEREGLVQRLRHRGARVVELSWTDLGEVYSLRAAIEELAVRLAVRRGTEQDIAVIDASLGDMRSALRKRVSEQAAARLDVEFHDAIFQASHHDRLYSSWVAIRMQVYLFLLRRNIANADWRVATIKGHADIADLIRARQEGPAAAEVRRHISVAYDHIISAADEDTDADQRRRIAESFLLS